MFWLLLPLPFSVWLTRYYFIVEHLKHCKLPQLSHFPQETQCRFEFSNVFKAVMSSLFNLRAETLFQKGQWAIIHTWGHFVWKRVEGSSHHTQLFCWRSLSVSRRPGYSCKIAYNSLSTSCFACVIEVMPPGTLEEHSQGSFGLWHQAGMYAVQSPKVWETGWPHSSYQSYLLNQVPNHWARSQAN